MNNKESLIQFHEGLRLKPYRDTVGKLTIGVGRNLDDVGISEEEALHMLDNDILRVEMELQKTFSWYQKLDDVRQAVVTDMCFNLGINRLLQFTNTLSAIEKKDYPEAAKQMLNSKWATQVGQRANRLSKMMLTGQWPKD